MIFQLFFCLTTLIGACYRLLFITPPTFHFMTPPTVSCQLSFRLSTLIGVSSITNLKSWRSNFSNLLQNYTTYISNYAALICSHYIFLPFEYQNPFFLAPKHSESSLPRPVFYLTLAFQLLLLSFNFNRCWLVSISTNQNSPILS